MLGLLHGLINHNFFILLKKNVKVLEECATDEKETTLAQRECTLRDNQGAHRV